ncbi:septation protein SepH [Kribbella sp. NBC_01505]|uniref:septation protein SepH n=1 Tax=Kribbella sp. NBC_01505 TaxID=2903580 RepID=UPI00386FCCAE
MREARLVGLSQDGTKLILAMSETGEEFAVPVDDRLRAALRGDRARLGQLEIQMESALRPRDIQARIRAGESPEAVAAVAQMPMERVMAFAGPVLAERDHIANLAQRASVRRRGGADAPTRNLGAWVTERLRTRHVDPASADWDAWRRDDGRWQVRVSYFVEAEDVSDPERKEEKIALFAYDAPGRYAVPDDDEARWLVGEQAQVLPPPAQPIHQPGERRLTAVADIDLSVAPDHGADSYEAGFEDTISLPRRNNPGNQPVSRDAERGPRRVHSVPNPDEEPTLIDVPIEQPPALHPTVRAVERPSQPPAETAAFAPPEERAAPPSNPFTERRDPAPFQESRNAPERPAGPPPGSVERGRPEAEPTRPPAQPPYERPAATTPAAPVRPVEQRQNESRPADPRQAEPRPAESRPADPRPTESRPVTPQPTAPRPTELRPQQPVAPTRPVEETRAPAQEQLPEEPAAEAAPTEEPKKKPAKRGSKRASVPSWDEIMFGKKAD